MVTILDTPLFPAFSSPPRRHGRRPAVRPAAGVLLRHTDRRGGRWVLLGLRTRRLGGTWANIGGSIHPGEHPLAGALREFHEEVGLPASRLSGARLTATVDCGTEARPYTMFVLDGVTPFYDAALSWEHDDLAWFPEASVDDLPLHAGFARAWAGRSSW